MRVDTGIGLTGTLEDFPADSEAQLTREIVEQIGAEPIPAGVGSQPDHVDVPFVSIVGLQDYGILVGDRRGNNNGPPAGCFLDRSIPVTLDITRLNHQPVPNRQRGWA